MGAAGSGAGCLGLDQTYVAVPESVATIRAAVAGLASGWGAPPRVVQAVTLAASEAATNVVLHAYRDSGEPGHIEVIGTLAADELVVTVRDSGIGLRPHRDSPGLGLGLAIIAQQTDRLDLLDSPAGGVELRMYFALRRAS